MRGGAFSVQASFRFSAGGSASVRHGANRTTLYGFMPLLYPTSCLAEVRGSGCALRLRRPAKRILDLGWFHDWLRCERSLTHYTLTLEDSQRLRRVPSSAVDLCGSATSPWAAGSTFGRATDFGRGALQQRRGTVWAPGARDVLQRARTPPPSKAAWQPPIGGPSAALSGLLPHTESRLRSGCAVCERVGR